MNGISAACGLAISLVVSGALALSGCAPATVDRPYQPYQPGYVVQNGAAYDGYYDGYYGTYSGGYWSNDGYFYYRDTRNLYRRDDQRHFRREQFPGSSQFRAEQRDRAHYDHNNRDYSYDHGRMRSGQGGANRYRH